MPLWLGGRSSYTPNGTPPNNALAWTQVVWKVRAGAACWRPALKRVASVP
jgi:hypothetical protein